MHGGWERLEKAMLCRCGLTFFISKGDERKEEGRCHCQVTVPQAEGILGSKRRVSKGSTKKRRRKGRRGRGKEEEEEE